MSEDFNALCTPLASLLISGINLKNLNDLKTLNNLNTNKNDILDSKLKICENKAGNDKIIKIKSNLFHFDKKYFFIPHSLNLIPTSTINKEVIRLSTKLNMPTL